MRIQGVLPFFILLWLMACPAVGLFAQQYPNHLVTASVDPEADSLAIQKMRMKMEHIRKTQHRPTVALVLSGGGARGSAHVGVLRFLEEMDLPIDMICGTSMGGLIGGLYSLGYSAAAIDSVLKVQDWDVTLTDVIPDTYIPYKVKQRKNRFLITIPFHYASLKDDPNYAYKEALMNNNGGLDLGAGGGDINTQAGVNSLASSLPSGYVQGFNLNSLLSSLSVGYHDSLSFADLPTPFFPVSADLIHCEAKYWTSGDVREAMRSTSAIPGMFAPIRTDQYVLVDGGIRNNFPVDLARAMGADYVIGVEVSSSANAPVDVDNVGGILLRLTDMGGHDAYRANINKTDVLIVPRLDEYGMLSFNPDAIADIIERGYEAAVLHTEELSELKRKMPSASLTRSSVPALDLSGDTIGLSTIEFEDLSRHESRMMLRKTGLAKKQHVSKPDLDRALCEIQSTNAFETSSYSLYGDAEPYRLVFESVKKPVHQIGFGFRMDTQDGASFLIDLGLNVNKLRGLKMDVESRVSQNFYVKSLFSLDFRTLPSLNLDVKWFSNNHDFLFGDMASLGSLRYTGHAESLYFSNSTMTFLDLKVGLQNRCYGTSSFLSHVGQPQDLLLDGKAFSAFLSTDVCTFDDRYFPTKGIKLGVRAEWMLEWPNAMDFSKTVHSFDLTRPIVAFDYYRAFSNTTSKTTLLLDFHGRSIFQEQPLFFMGNMVGGVLPGRYLDQQVPFVGSNRMFLADNHILAGNAEFRVTPFKNVYFSALAGGYSTAPALESLFTKSSRTIYGFGAQVGYNSLAGPIKLLVNWSNLERDFGFYISAGFDF